MYGLFSQNKLSRLCDACHLTVAWTTFGRQDVIQTLRKVDRGFYFSLPHSIVTGTMRQRIEKAVTDDDVLGHIRNVCLSDVEFRFFFKNNTAISYSCSQ